MTFAWNNAWRAVVFLWAAFFLAYMSRQAVSSTFAGLRADLGFTEAQLGLVGAVFLWTYAVINPLAGLMGDRMHKPTLLSASLVLWAGAVALMGAAWSPVALLAGRAALALAQGLYAPTAVAFISQIHGPASRATAITAHATAQYAGVIAGGWYGGAGSESFGWRWMFFSLAMVTVLYAGVLRFALRGYAAGSAAATGPRDRSPMSAIFRTVSYLAICVAFIAVCAILWIVYTWLPDLVRERFRLSAGAAGFSGTAFVQISMIFGLLIGAPLGDWASRKSPSGRVWVMAAGLLLSSPFVYLIVAADGLTGMKLASAGYGLFKGLFSANMWAALLAVCAKDRSTFAVGFCNSLGAVFGGVSSYMVGALKTQYPVATLFGATAVLGVVAAGVLAVAAWRYYPRDLKHED
ncbi:MAG: MFS transporter [Acidobacteria bacterium]|nr:MFS transporter [Acidobacteriota bacterium]